MDRRANVKWIYAIGVVLIITNAASGVNGVKPDNFTLGRLDIDNAEFGSKCCQTLKEMCGCNMLKTTWAYEHIYPIRTINGMLEFKFKVKTQRNASVIFSPTWTSSEGADGDAYVINLSEIPDADTTSNRSYSIAGLATGWYRPRAVQIEMESVLSPNEWREFWVQIKPGYTVKVGRKDEHAFIELKNAPDYNIRFYSVATWNPLPSDYGLWNLPCIEEKDFSW